MTVQCDTRRLDAKIEVVTSWKSLSDPVRPRLQAEWMDNNVIIQVAIHKRFETRHASQHHPIDARKAGDATATQPELGLRAASLRKN
jgi:hypothetical protein